MTAFRQWRVMVGKVAMFSNEHGKFLPITDQDDPHGPENGQNGNDVPQEDQ